MMNLGVKTGFCTRGAHFFPVLCSKNTKKFLLLQCTSKKKLKHMAKSTFLQDFKAFAIKGNAIDMAVGVIIGGAFGKIVSSLVNDVLMPLLGTIIGGIDLTALSITIGDAKIAYGNFLQNVFDFVIIAFCIFLFIKGISSLSKKKEEEPAAAPEPSNEEKLLAEIRDLLKNK